MQQAPATTGRPASVTEALVLRPVRPADAARLHAFLEQLSLRSVQQRFWSGGPNLLRLTRELTGEGRCGVVACDPSGAIVGHGECVLLAAGAGEVAVVVADALQGRGLGTRLVQRVTELASGAGVTRCVASVHPDNAAMLRVFTRRCGATVQQLGDEVRATFELAPPSLRDVA